jgi:predicted Zn-dependent protease with MMP-like domain
MQLSDERFDALVNDALDLIPEKFAELVSNLVVLVEDWPPDGMGRNILGLYHGEPLGMENAGRLPSQIFVYRRPLLAMCRSEAELVEQVRVTVVHEVGHHFGLDDARLHELGWG